MSMLFNPMIVIITAISTAIEKMPIIIVLCIVAELLQAHL